MTVAVPAVADPVLTPALDTSSFRAGALGSGVAELKHC
jgi:hypothetical protein